MSLTNSPKFEDEFNNAPLEQPTSHDGGSNEEPPSPSRRRAPVVIAVLVMLILASGLLLVNRGGSSTPTGTSTIRGQVVDAQGAGVTNARVYVEGMTSLVTTDASGSFTITNAPAGQVWIVVGVTPEAPKFVSVAVAADATKDVGQIVYEAGS